jgi:hypothetical protein
VPVRLSVAVLSDIVVGSVGVVVLVVAVRVPVAMPLIVIAARRRA